MAATQEAYESLRERARRALLDNPDPGDLHASSPPPDAQPEARSEVGRAAGAEYAELIDLRLRAIRLMRDTAPRRACYEERVNELSQALVDLAKDSIHYRAALEKLREAHREWSELEEKLWAAMYIIRSTQWLVDLLADPSGPESRPAREVAAAHEGK